MPRFSLPRLLSSTATFHLRHFSTNSIERLRNVWISGLIDPAKVTVSERYMLYTGQMKKMEDARIKSERRDRYLQVGIEKGRRDRAMGIIEDFSPDQANHVSADITFFNWKNHKMSVINTSEYFPNEVEVNHALAAFDSAILVLCSVVGVQRYSSTFYTMQRMNEYDLPRLIFINNVDQKGANPWEVLNQAIRASFMHGHDVKSAAIQVPIGLEDDFKGLVDLVQLKAYYFHGSNGENVVVEEVPADMDSLVSEKRHELVETVSEVDDKLAEAFSSDRPISAADLEEAIRRATIARKFIPVFMGSAFKYKGLQLLLDGVLNCLPCPCDPSNYALDQSKNVELVPNSKKQDELVALAFTLNRKYAPITYLRIYKGVIRKGDSITNVNTGETFKLPGSIEIRQDDMAFPRSCVMGIDDFGIPYWISVHNDEAIQKVDAGEIVALHDVNSLSGCWIHLSNKFDGSKVNTTYGGFY